VPETDTTGRFDQDDVGAEIGQNSPDAGPSLVGEVHNSQATQG
jgi:hypothetical protein